MNIGYVKLMKAYYGGEKQTEELILGLKKRGHRLFLLALPKSKLSQRLKDLPQRSFNLYPYPNKRLKSLIFVILLPMFLVKFYFLAKKIVKENQLKVVCLQEPYEKIVCGPIFKILKVKVCWLEVTFWEPFLKKNTLIFWFLILSLRFCDGIIFSSDFLKAQIGPYLKSGRHKIKTAVIKHALQKGDQQALGKIQSSRYPIKNIGFIGSITEMKGVFVLLAAFLELIEQKPNLKLFYAGEGDDIKKLQTKIKQDKLESWVKTLGRKKPSDFYREIDLLVVPSNYENLPYVIQEAMAAKIPVIGSNVGGIPEYFPGSAKKWLSRPGNSHDLAEKITEISQLSRDELKKLAEQNFVTYQNNFNFKKMVEATELFFLNLTRKDL